MNYGLYLDPGVDKLAAAYGDLDTRALVSAAMHYREDFALVPVTLPKALVIERMRIYPEVSKEDPNDLIDVTQAAAFAEGAIVARGGPRALWVYAKDWKGQIKKPHHHSRLWSVLAPSERAILAAAIGMSEAAIEKKLAEACRRLALTGKVTGYSWTAHNLFDAVGLFLWHVKRVGIAGHRFGLTGKLNIGL